MEAVKFEELPVYGKINFQGEQFFCDHDGAMFWPDENCLIVSDLHLEKGAAMASRGSLVPPYDTGETLQKLAGCIDRWRPETVICLGDSFHCDDSAIGLPDQYRSQLLEMIQTRKWIWITGNHDPAAPQGLEGDCHDQLTIGSVQFRHDQKYSQIKADLFTNPYGEVSGHLHPCAIIHRRGKRLRRRCFAGDPWRLIMPAFGAFTGGLDVHDPAFSGLFDTEKMRVWMLGRNRVYEISGNQLSGPDS